MIAKKKIFVTGISSSIVQRLVLLLDLSAYEVVGISRNPSAVRLSDITVVQGDIREARSYSYLLEDCYMIIHGAAVTHSRSDREYYEVNLYATEKLVEAAKNHRVARFVFISSNTAGSESGTYGLTKLLAEQAIQTVGDWTILRPSEVYGGDKKEGIEKLIEDVRSKSIVLCPTDIPSKLCPIYIQDAAHLMQKYIFDNRSRNQKIIVSGPKKFSYLEVVELVKRISGRKVKVIFLSKRFMFFIRWIVRICPLNLGIVPDQVDRLYAKKHVEVNQEASIQLKAYVKKLVNDDS